MTPSQFKPLLPDQEVEFGEEIAGDEVFHLRVKLSQEQSDTLDPASYVHHEWVETAPEKYKLRVKNITGSPVYVSMEDTDE